MCLFHTKVVARPHTSVNNQVMPVFSGTVFAYYSQNTAPGVVYTDSLIFAGGQYGSYTDTWSYKNSPKITQIQAIFAIETGVTRFLDIALLLEGTNNYYHNKTTFLFNDLQLQLGWQISDEVKGTWIPDSRLIVGEIFPTGKYENLNPDNLVIEAGGMGAFQTAFIFVLQKIFFTFPNNPYNFNLNLIYNFPYPVKVKNFNTYGGGYGTRGNVNPGQKLIVNLAYEILFTKYWGIGINYRYEHTNRSSFKGKYGSQNNKTSSVGLPSSELFSLSPSIEYNPNENISFVLGPWFSLGGRNTPSFVKGVAYVFAIF